MKKYIFIWILVNCNFFLFGCNQACEMRGMGSSRPLGLDLWGESRSEQLGRQAELERQHLCIAKLRDKK